MSRAEVERLVRLLHDAQADATNRVIRAATHDDLGNATPDGFTVLDVLQMWSHELRSHQRELVLARGRLTDDNPHFHVPHFVRRANEEFGRLVGELACCSDEQLDDALPCGGRSVREIAEHVLAVLRGYVPDQVERGCTRKP